jgi:hypothetical protein
VWFQDEMRVGQTNKLRKADKLDRLLARRAFERRFTVDAMADEQRCSTSQGLKPFLGKPSQEPPRRS